MKDKRLTSILCLVLGLFLSVIRVFLSLTNSPSDTEHLDLLINGQDDILDHLEVAETRYITSILTSHCAEVHCIATSKLGGKSLR